MVPAAEWHDAPGSRIVVRAFRLAVRESQACRPVHLLRALAEVDGPIGELLYGIRPTDGPEQGGAAGPTYLFAQLQEAAADLAATRDESLAAPHLTVALLEQRDAEAMSELEVAHISTDALMAAALGELGSPAGSVSFAMPPLTPAGTLDRPALDIAELDPRAWHVLTWRCDHLPVDRVRHGRDAAALSRIEQRAAWQVAHRAGVDDDQRYSLLAHHQREVDRRVGLAGHGSGEQEHRAGIWYAGRRRRVPNFMVGWPTWFANRRAGVHQWWFALRTRAAYRGCPGLAER